MDAVDIQINQMEGIVSNTLDTLYEVLDFQSGSLLMASDKPTSALRLDDWLEKGEWPAAAKRAGADKVFFVENNPVAVFAECGSDYLEEERAFNRLWCLGRPRLLFLASPGEISVLDLAQEPIFLSEKPSCFNWSKLSLFKILFFKKLFSVFTIFFILSKNHGSTPVIL